MSRRFAYRRGGWLRYPIVRDLGLVVLLVWFDDRTSFGLLLAAAILVTVAWSAVSLHWPSRVEIDDLGIAFFSYGRVHRFAWCDIEGIRVRRFIVRDRVLVRIVPGSPWRGRYWLLSAMEGYGALLGVLEARGSAPSPTLGLPRGIRGAGRTRELGS